MLQLLAKFDVAGKILEVMENECGGEEKFRKALEAGRIFEGEDGLYYAREKIQGKSESKGRTMTAGVKDAQVSKERLDEFRSSIQQLGWKLGPLQALDLRGR